MIDELNNHRAICFTDTAIVSLEYARKHYNCYCKDRRSQLAKAIDFDVKLVIMYNNHIIGVII